MRVISRSSYQAFDDCPRKGYWSYIYKGGLDSLSPSYPLLIGQVVHSGMEAMLNGERDDEALTEVMLEAWV
jgi:hypothetical protein